MAKTKVALDSNVRSTFTLNDYYSWNIKREKGYYLIGGSVADTNSLTDSEKPKAKTEENAVSILALYHIKGTGNMTA